MSDIRTVPAEEYNLKLAKKLKDSGDFEAPKWIAFVKSGASKQRPNTDPDFWYKRAASILRQAYTREIIGVGRLRTRYGGRKNRGVRPSEFRPAGGKMIRTIVQQAEKAGLLERATGKKAGRKLTIQGKKFMEELK